MNLEIGCLPHYCFLISKHFLSKKTRNNRTFYNEKNLVFWQVLIFVHETKYRKKIISKSWTIWELWLLQLYIFSDNQIFPPLIDCDPIIIYYCMIAAPSILRKKRRPKCANFLCRTSCHELKAHCHKIREIVLCYKIARKIANRHKV